MPRRMRLGESASDRSNALPARLGKHAILGAIGRGGMADVYLAMAHGPSGVRKLVVVKRMHTGNEVDSTLARMFLDEGRLAALLNHANVVHTYEVAEGQDGSYIVMEYLHGQALSALARAAKPLASELSVRIAADALAGLHYAHELRDLDGTALSIVHRDLSPPNIFVTYDGVVKLVDFGIAKTAIATRVSTEAGLVKGKLAYMAPEQATSGSVDRRADIYAMGVVLWELLTGRRLVEDLSPASIIRRSLHGGAPLVSSVRADIDPALDRIVERALSREPEARYPTALEMREALEEVLARGRAASTKELGRLMAEHFSVQREQRESQIRAWAATFPPDASPDLEVITRRVSLSELPVEQLASGSRSAARLAPLRSGSRLARNLLLGGVLVPGVTALAFYSGKSARSEAPRPAVTAAASTNDSSPAPPSPAIARAHARTEASLAPSADKPPAAPAIRPARTTTARPTAPSASPATAARLSAPKAQAPALESNPYLHSQ